LFWNPAQVIGQEFCPDSSKHFFGDVGIMESKTGVTVKLMNGSQVAYTGTVFKMGDSQDLTVLVQVDDMTFEAWGLERYQDFFIASSYQRIS
jgi:hypothetical protein